MNIFSDSDENSNADDSADFDKDKVGAEGEELGDEDEDAEEEDAEEDEESDEDDDDEESESIFDDPDYLVVGSDEELSGNLPDWVESIISDRKSLVQDLEKLDLEPSDYISVPDTDDNGELKDFLDELGFSIDSQLIDRGPGSSHDSVVYIKESDIPAAIAVETKTLNEAKRFAIRAAKSRLRKSLSGPRIKNADLYHELHRLIAVSRANDEDWRKKSDKIDELEEDIKDLNEHLSDRDKNLQLLREKLKKTEKKLERAGVKNAGEISRVDKYIKRVLDQTDLYLGWTSAVGSQFNILINGPVLKLPSGKVYAINSIYGRQLENDESGVAIIDWINKEEPTAELIRISTSHRLGMTSWGQPDWSRAQGFFAGRLSWTQIWWVVFSYVCGKAYARANLNGIDLGAELFEIPIERSNEFRELFEKHWGKGVRWDEKFDDHDEDGEI
jgi:hypothetical protein